MRVDSTTLSDLEIFRSADGAPSLFSTIDRTQTTVGSKALRRRLENPLSDVQHIREVQQSVRFFVQHREAIWLDETAMTIVQRYLRSNIEAESSSSPIHTAVKGVWLSLRYRDLYQELKSGVDSTLQFLKGLRDQGRELLALDPPTDIHLMASELERVCDGFLSGEPSTATSGSVLSTDRLLRNEGRVELEHLIDLAGELDALRSMADTTLQFGWILPEFVDSRAFELEVEGLHHPFVRSAVSNPLDLTGGEPMVFLTGPNMAGKTTYLRSAALLVFLAHVGMGVPAGKARLTPGDVLFTSLNPSDNLRAGLSYFLAEVKRVKAAAEILARGERAFVLFDEVFKGTNVRDALEASAEVILGFARANGSGFIFSSHLIELVEKLRANPSIRFHCFDGNVVKGVTTYSYELKNGGSDQRLGLLLLRQERVPELLSQIGA